MSHENYYANLYFKSTKQFMHTCNFNIINYVIYALLTQILLCCLLFKYNFFHFDTIYISTYVCTDE